MGSIAAVFSWLVHLPFLGFVVILLPLALIGLAVAWAIVLRVTQGARTDVAVKAFRDGLSDES